MTADLFSLADRVAVITGGTGAIGSALAAGLAQAGARIAVLARSADDVGRTASGLEASGHEAIGIAADVLDAASLEAARDAILARFGPSTCSSTVPAGTSPRQPFPRTPRRSTCRSRLP